MDSAPHTHSPTAHPAPPLYRAGLPYAESTWEEAAHVKPLAGAAAALKAHKAAAASPCVPPSASVAAVRPEELEKLDESPEFGDCGRTLRS